MATARKTWAPPAGGKLQQAISLDAALWPQLDAGRNLNPLPPGTQLNPERVGRKEGKDGAASKPFLQLPQAVAPKVLPTRT